MPSELDVESSREHVLAWVEMPGARQAGLDHRLANPCDIAPFDDGVPATVAFLYTNRRRPLGRPSLGRPSAGGDEDHGAVETKRDIDDVGKRAGHLLDVCALRRSERRRDVRQVGAIRSPLETRAKRVGNGHGCPEHRPRGRDPEYCEHGSCTPNTKTGERVPKGCDHPASRPSLRRSTRSAIPIASS